MLPVSTCKPAETKPVEPERSGDEVLADLLEDLECLDSPPTSLRRLVDWAEDVSEHRRDAEEARQAMQDQPELADAYADLDACEQLIVALVELRDCVDEMPSLRRGFRALQRCGAEIRGDMDC